MADGRFKVERNAPGRQRCKVFTLAEFFGSFIDDEAAMQWFIQNRPGDTPNGPHCGSEHVNMKARRPDMPRPCRARGCRWYFSVKIGTVMECSSLGRRDWLVPFS